MVIGENWLLICIISGWNTEFNFRVLGCQFFHLGFVAIASGNDIITFFFDQFFEWFLDLILWHIVFGNAFNLVTIDLHHMISRPDKIFCVGGDFIIYKNKSYFDMFFFCFHCTMDSKGKQSHKKRSDDA